MSRLLLLLLVSLGFTVPPANAAEPGPTNLWVQFYGDGDHAGQTIEVIAHVRPADSGPEYPAGSVVFSMGDPAPVPVDPDYLTARTTITIPSNEPFSVTAAFTGTGGWGDSTATGTFQPLSRVFWTPNPTIARVGAGGLTATLGFSAYRRNSLGDGVPGRKIAFTLFAPVPNLSVPNRTSVPVCTATTDANGLARCTGNVLLATVVSLLSGGAFASDMSPPYPGFDSVRLPALVVGG